MESDPWSSSTVLFVKAEASLVDTVGGLLHTLVGDASKSPHLRQTPVSEQVLASVTKNGALIGITVSTRFNWSPHTSWFTVRMPTSTHYIFTELLIEEIGSQLKIVACEDTDIATVLDLVRSGSTSDIYLYGHEAIDERYPKHTSDASFAHAHSQYPSLVIETSYP